MNTRTKEDCIHIMQQKAGELERLPKKSDFDKETVSRIKSFLGPWPRALEAAGVKDPDPMRLEKKREKRRRARENQIKYRVRHPKRKSKGGNEK